MHSGEVHDRPSNISDVRSFISTWVLEDQQAGNDVDEVRVASLLHALDNGGVETMNALHIQRCKEEELPLIVKEAVENLLTIQAKEDIPRLIDILRQLKSQGVRAVWDSIKVDVTQNAIEVCGTIFPVAAIEEGKDIPLNFLALCQLVNHRIQEKWNDPESIEYINQILQLAGILGSELRMTGYTSSIIDLTPVTPVAEPAPAPIPTPSSASFLAGFRHGFLQSQPPVERRKQSQAPSVGKPK